jgi:hypothetical protein
MIIMLSEVVAISFARSSSLKCNTLKIVRRKNRIEKTEMMILKFFLLSSSQKIYTINEYSAIVKRMETTGSFFPLHTSVSSATIQAKRYKNRALNCLLRALRFLRLKNSGTNGLNIDAKKRMLYIKLFIFIYRSNLMD